MTQKDNELNNKSEIMRSVLSDKTYELLSKCFVDECVSKIPIWLGVATIKDLIIYCPVSLHEKVLAQKEDLVKLIPALNIRQIYIHRVDKAYQEYSGSNPQFNVTEYLRKYAKWDEHKRWLEMCWLSERPLVGTDR